MKDKELNKVYGERMYELGKKDGENKVRRILLDFLGIDELIFQAIEQLQDQ